MPRHGVCCALVIVCVHCRLARTVAKPASSSGGLVSGAGRLNTAGTGRLGLVRREGRAFSGLLGAHANRVPCALQPVARPTTTAAATAAATPSLAGSRSRLGGPLVAPTPSLASMKSAAGFHPLLPKTPALRRPRRGEVTYAVSENGSPLGLVK